MEPLPRELAATTEKFLENVTRAFGGQLRAVIMYGPAARGETAKTPYINFLVVVEDNSPSELARCTPYLKSWRKRLIATPLFFTPAYIARSLDTFPLEFMAMRHSHRLVSGDDLLADLTFDPADIRSQCERELKGKLIHLRAEYLTLRGDRKGLMDLVNRSLETFRLVFLGLLDLKGIEPPRETGNLVTAVVGAFGLHAAVFDKLQAVAGGQLVIDDQGTDALFDRYVEELVDLSDAVDEMIPGEPAEPGRDS